ncbi:MAG: long-chain fatty acid--CoA ligase, partial [Desulfovibrio sp.]
MVDSHWLLRRMATFGDAPALAQDDQVVGYAQLLDATEQAAIFLRNEGVTPGQCVAVLSDYTIDGVAMFLALLANCNIIAPISTTKDEEIRLRLEEGCVETLISLSGSGYGVEPVPNHGSHEFLDTLRDAGRPGLILFSSGSTGKPKAMVHDLDRLLGVYESRKPRSMAILVFLMFDHIGGLNTLFNGLAMGAFLV